MKRFLYCILLNLFAIANAFAQQQTDGRVAFFPIVNNESGIMPKAVVSALESKMQQIVTSDGYGSASRADRFVLVAKPTVVTKDVAPTTPPRINQTVEFTFIVGDVVENKTYASCSLTLTGIGTNETKAWSTAIAKIKPANEEFKKMLADAAEKIESYYATNCNTIISKAETCAGMGKYDEAIASLVVIPNICSDCFDKAQQKVLDIYQRKIDSEGTELLSKANSAWSASPNSDGARKAFQYLSQIGPESKAFAEKEALEKAIMAKLSVDEQRKWEQEAKHYNDEVKLKQKEQQNAHQRQLATIAACRSVAEKWAENQPQTKVYLNW